MKPWRIAKISHVWLLLPLIGVVLAAIQPIRDNSFLWHVRAGHVQAAAGQVLTTDPFSFSFSGMPWRTQSWLVELIFAWLGDGLGWVGPYLALVSGLTLLAIGVAVYETTRSVRLTAVLVVWIELVGLPYFTPRPVILSFLLLSLLLLALKVDGLRWTIPLLMWVWASMHGSFVLGGGLIVLDGLARREPRRMIDAMAAAVAVSMTAHGWHVWEITLAFLRSSEALSFMTEWSSPDILSRQVLPFTGILVAILLSATRGRLASRDLWVVAPFVVFGLSTSRAVMPASLVLIVYLAGGIGPLPIRRDDASIMATAVALAFVLTSGFVLATNRVAIDTARFPVGLVSSLDDLPTFHDDIVGGYLIFREMPSSMVVFDDRAELYPADFIRSVISVRSGTPEWASFFSKYGVKQALVRRSDGLTEVLGGLPGWSKVAADPQYILWRADGT